MQFETENELFEKQEVKLEIREEGLPPENNETSRKKQSLLEYLKKTAFQFESIKIFDQSRYENREEEDENNGIRIFKIQHMEVIYDLEPNKMIILRDITDLVQKEYNRSIQKLTEIMVASTSHDMRTPLNSIINMHLMIEKKVSDPNVLKWLSIARCSSNLLMFLVNDTLDYF